MCEQANATQSVASLGKFNNLGIPISLVDEQLGSKKNRDEMVKNLIADRVKSAETRNELVKEVFYIISMAYFGCTQGTYIPAELGVVKYSLQDGVMARMHMYINPGKIPLGVALSTQSHTNNTHKLPMPPNAWGITNKNEIAKRLLTFLAADDEIPQLFTNEESLPIVEGMLREMLSDNIKDEKLYVCPLAELFHILQQATERFLMVKLIPLSNLDTHDVLKKDCYAFTEGISCKYHEKERNVLHCALSQATRWAYIISKYCCQDMGIACIPGKHIPGPINACLDDFTVQEGEFHVKPCTSGIASLSIMQEESADSHTDGESFNANTSRNSLNTTSYFSESEEDAEDAKPYDSSSQNDFDESYSASESSNSNETEIFQNATSGESSAQMQVQVKRECLSHSHHSMKLDDRSKQLMEWFDDMIEKKTAAKRSSLEKHSDVSCTETNPDTQMPDKESLNDTKTLSVSNELPHKAGVTTQDTDNNSAMSELREEGTSDEIEYDRYQRGCYQFQRGCHRYQRSRIARRGYYTQRRGYNP